MEVDQHILDLAANPISSDAPCGINAKYESIYETLETEIAKSESLTSESTEWTDVRKLSTQILQETSKDYSVACYLAYSLTHTNGYKGLLEGITLLEKLSENFWDGMFPPKKRLRGRQNSTQWLIEKVSTYIEANEPSNSDMAFISDVAKSVKNLDYFLSDKMAENAPNFSDISRPLKRLKAIAEQTVKAAPTPAVQVPEDIAPVAQKPEPEVEKQIPVESAPVSTENIAPSPAQTKPAVAAKPSTTMEVIGDIANDMDSRKALKQTQENLRKLASYYGQVKASDPRRFRLSRSALWDGLDKLPPVKDNKSQLPSPPKDKLKKLIELYESGEYLEALNFGEQIAKKLPYWFDGNRYIALSLSELGAEFEHAANALETEVANFVGRLPKIIDLQYANGEPFATEQSKVWMNSLLMKSSGSDNNAAPETDAIATAFSEAKKLAIAGKLSEGFALLNGCTANTKRDQFKIKMACAELACINGNTKVGIPMLERLIEETRTLKVADWESDFLAKALALLVNAYEKLNESDANNKQQQKDAAYNQLCWYNPALLTSNS